VPFASSYVSLHLYFGFSSLTTPLCFLDLRIHCIINFTPARFFPVPYLCIAIEVARRLPLLPTDQLFPSIFPHVSPSYFSGSSSRSLSPDIEPVSLNYHHRNCWTAPSPACGPTLFLFLNIPTSSFSRSFPSHFPICNSQSRTCTLPFFCSITETLLVPHLYHLAHDLPTHIAANSILHQQHRLFHHL